MQLCRAGNFEYIFHSLVLNLSMNPLVTWHADTTREMLGINSGLLSKIDTAFFKRLVKSVTLDMLE